MRSVDLGDLVQLSVYVIIWKPGLHAYLTLMLHGTKGSGLACFLEIGIFQDNHWSFAT